MASAELSSVGAVVLVVDGDPTLQALIQKLCAMNGLLAREVADRATALQFLDIETPTAVICGSRLGDGDGIDLVRELRPRLPSVILVVLLAAEDGDRELEARDAGADFVVALPAAADSVLDVVRSIASRRRIRDMPALLAMMPRLLLVEEDSWLAGVLRRGLAASFAVTVTSTAGAALDDIRSRGEPDLVLSELRLPDMQVEQFHDRLDAIAPGLSARAIYMTGGSVTDTLQSFLSSIPGRWIHKPFPMSSVRALLASVLERERPGN
ncbi:MAG TPA: response regulator [Kofleriaceae bacterium]|nr:response regulator [Kofleriaceae bacterium]